ncbi:MAG: FtsQ-type POTRA domain-containing protein [Candidatus Krumholzibacteriota bacterium]|nr:FtsQ-type POTRA domain-containing protein [Candidatus Krumholzibacteriota bacterium]
MRSFNGRAAARTARRRRRIRRAAVVSLVVILAAGGAWLVLETDRFLLRDVTVNGSAGLPVDSIRVVADRYVGANLVTLPVKRIREEILRLPEVCDVQLRRRPFHALDLYVTGREPILLLADGEETVELDATGAAVPRRGSGGVDLPVLTGLSGRDLETEEGRLLVGKAIEVLGLLGEFGFPPDRHLSEIHVDGREVDLVWMETGTLIRTGSGGYREKIMKLRAVYGALDEDGRFPSLVDLRFDRQVVVR